MTSRPRGPGVVYALAALVLVVLLAAIAMTARQAPPPTIAEFAPQAVESITDSPNDQSSVAGRGGGNGDGWASQAPESGGLPTPAVIDVPRVRKCVGDPPRQIEDPQSPPCVPYWQGDNGGATARGVTRDEIRVALPAGQDPGGLADALTAFFNKRFEFYGRRITLWRYKPTGGNSAGMGADAATVDQQLGAFADLSYVNSLDGRESLFYDELARRGVISVQTASHHGVSTVDEAHYTKYTPYQWNFLPSVDVILRGYSSFICSSLAGRPPRYAGSPQNAAAARIFGVIFQQYSDGTPPVDVTPMRPKCGAKLAEVTWEPNVASATNAILQLKDAGVTSVLCLCQRDQLGNLVMTSATAQQYYPEWMISNFGFQDDDLNAREWPHDQLIHVYGLMSFNKWNPESERPIWWAAKEMNPATSSTWNWEGWTFYWNMLVLASGVQMAGPRLTPQAFAEGLYRTVFPNPGCGAPPFYQGCVGFGRNDHSMIDDLALVWWSQTDQTVTMPHGQTATGTYCYVGLGKRYSPSRWPAEDPPLFQQPCR